MSTVLLRSQHPPGNGLKEWRGADDSLAVLCMSRKPSNNFIKFGSMDNSNWQCEGQLLFEILDILSSDPKTKNKKIYINYHLMRKTATLSSIQTCSYSLNVRGNSYLSKDQTRSKIDFKEVLIKEDLQIKIDIFLKQTFGKKVLWSAEFTIFELLKLANGSASFTDRQFAFADGTRYRMNFEIIPNSNSQLPGQVSKFFESPLGLGQGRGEGQGQEDLKCSPDSVEESQHVSESKEEEIQGKGDGHSTESMATLTLNSHLSEQPLLNGKEEITTSTAPSAPSASTSSGPSPSGAHVPDPSPVPPTQNPVRETVAHVSNQPPAVKEDNLSRASAKTGELIGKKQILIETQLPHVPSQPVTTPVSVAAPPRSITPPLVAPVVAAPMVIAPVIASVAAPAAIPAVATVPAVVPLAQPRAPLNRTLSRTKSPAIEPPKTDHLYAIAGTGSRVSTKLIKQLSQSKILDDSSLTSENSSTSLEGITNSQTTALSWLEQQYAEDTPTPTRELRFETPPAARRQAIDTGKSPTNLSDSGSESPYLDSKKSTNRSLFLPMHSTIIEEGSKGEDNHIASSNNNSNDNEHPLLNTQPRKFLTKFSRSVSSLTEAPEEEENDGLNLSPATRKRMKRRTSISTIAPHASFDDRGDGGEVEEKDESDRIMSGKFLVPKVSIDEYDENFFEREGDESVHNSFQRSQSDHSITSQPPVVLSAADNLAWKKTTGTGIRKARRKNLSTPTKRGRATLSTAKSVKNWDQTASAAEVVRATMEERIRDDCPDEEFSDVGTTIGLTVWIVDRGALRVLSTEDIGLFYTSDCYLILSTEGRIKGKSDQLTHSLHTWIGSRAEKDKCTIAAFKAQRLSKHFGGLRIITNLEADESNEFIEVMFGNVTVVEGSIAESSLKKHSNRQGPDNSIRLLLVSSSQSTSLFPSLGTDRTNSPVLQAIPLTRDNFKSTSALILDTGEDLIYQWRGALVTQLTRARVFEAAFALRSERIKLNPKCRIEVIDESHEPPQFWELVDKFSIDQLDGDDFEESEDEGSFEDSIEEEEENDEDHDSDHFSMKSDDGSENENLSHKSKDSDTSEVLYDLDYIREYCADQMDGHAEMHRRQIISQSRILDPQAFNLKDSSLEIDGVSGHNAINLYRIGYIDGHLHTSRLSGMNSEGTDFGPPKKSQLETKGVYLLDFKDEVYVWIGKESDADLRVAAMTIAKALLQHSKAEWVRAVRVTEGNEPMLFKTKFIGWHEADMQENSFRLRWNRLSISQNKSSGREKPLEHVLHESVKYMRHKRKRKTLLSTKQQNHRTVVRSKIAALERHAFHDVLAGDDGRGIAVVWKVVDSELRSIPKSEVGHFWTHEAYVILYGFTPTVMAEDEENSTGEDEAAPHFVIYFWQGPHTPEKAYPQWKLSILPQKKDEWIAQMGQIPPEIRVVQGREPLHFFKMFKHRYIVHFAFLHLIKLRNKAEGKVRVVQSEILKLEKLRLNNLPVPRRSYRRVSGVYNSPSSRQLLNAARSSPKTSPAGSRSPLHRDGSFTSIDSSVADDISAHTVPVGKSLFQMETSAGVLLFQVRGSGLVDEDVHAVQIEARATRLNSSDCYIAIRPSTRGQSFVWLWVGRGTQYFEQEAAGALAMMILRWVDHEAKGNQVRVVEEGAGEWFDRWIVKSFYRALGGYTQYTNFDLLQTPRYLRPYALRYPQLFICEHSRDEYTITMLERYCQSDLVENIAAILDAHYALFVWYGRLCSAAIKVTSMKVAKKFCK
jgi:hypothetical protein